MTDRESKSAGVTAAAQKWIRDLEIDPSLTEFENRPWANVHNRRLSGCIGNDFVLHEPRVGLRFFWNENQKFLCGPIHFTADAEGPPAHAHGASIALVFDEVLAYPVWRSNLNAFTANLNITFRKAIPLRSTQRFIARIVKVDGRKIHVEGSITSPDGDVVFAECRGLWVQSEKFGDLHKAKTSKL